jgi:hypothetical protein
MLKDQECKGGTVWMGWDQGQGAKGIDCIQEEIVLRWGNFPP